MLKAIYENEDYSKKGCLFILKFHAANMVNKATKKKSGTEKWCESLALDC